MRVLGRLRGPESTGSLKSEAVRFGKGVGERVFCRCGMGVGELGTGGGGIELVLAVLLVVARQLTIGIPGDKGI